MPPIPLPDPPLGDGVVALRPWRPGDRDAVLAAARDPGLASRTALPPAGDPAAFDAWLRDAERARRDGAALGLVAVDVTDTFLGAVDMRLDSGTPVLGGCLVPDARGRGYASRAVRLLRDHVRGLGFERLEMRTRRDDAAAHRVARAAGFAAAAAASDDELRFVHPVAYEVSADRDRLDAAEIHRWISTQAYWALGRARETMDAAIANSHCFGVYAPDGTQVAFARVITDGVTFAYLCDVFVRPGHRDRGLGRQLVRAVLDHPPLGSVRQVALATADAHGLYRELGFDDVEPGRWMILRR